MPPSRLLLREDYDATMLRGLARSSRDSRQTRRLLALAAVYDGQSRGDAAAPLAGWVGRRFGTGCIVSTRRVPTA